LPTSCRLAVAMASSFFLFSTSCTLQPARQQLCPSDGACFSGGCAWFEEDERAWQAPQSNRERGKCDPVQWHFRKVAPRHPLLRVFKICLPSRCLLLIACLPWLSTPQIEPNWRFSCHGPVFLAQCTCSTISSIVRSLPFASARMRDWLLSFSWRASHRFTRCSGEQHPGSSRFWKKPDKHFSKLEELYRSDDRGQANPSPQFKQN